jgi:5-enolpyruvylshikimate-3-phosphate synthase
MAFAVAGLVVRDVIVDDSGCVAKSNPRFWSDFGRLEG